MIITSDISTLRSALAQRRTDKIILIPTMGNLHEGHLALVKKAQTYSPQIVVSIFVNPLQFGPKEDFNTYPRTLDADLKKLTALGVPFVFTPTTDEMYPEINSHTEVSVPKISQELCGHFRPGFFNGVATIVAKLFNIVQPQVAIFGEKDFQQLHIIKKMVKDLCFPIKIIGVPTVREANGVAMSSRNNYLSPEEKTHAAQLYICLQQLKQKLQAGNRNYNALIAEANEALKTHHFKMDYIAIKNRHTLLDAAGTDTELAILMAGWLGGTRLIDNLLVNLTKNEKS